MSFYNPNEDTVSFDPDHPINHINYDSNQLGQLYDSMGVGSNGPNDDDQNYQSNTPNSSNYNQNGPHSFQNTHHSNSHMPLFSNQYGPGNNPHLKGERGPNNSKSDKNDKNDPNPAKIEKNDHVAYETHHSVELPNVPLELNFDSKVMQIRHIPFTALTMDEVRRRRTGVNRAITPNQFKKEYIYTASQLSRHLDLSIRPDIGNIPASMLPGAFGGVDNSLNNGTNATNNGLNNNSSSSQSPNNNDEYNDTRFPTPPPPPPLPVDDILIDTPLKVIEQSINREVAQYAILTQPQTIQQTPNIPDMSNLPRFGANIPNIMDLEAPLEHLKHSRFQSLINKPLPTGRNSVRLRDYITLHASLDPTEAIPLDPEQILLKVAIFDAFTQMLMCEVVVTDDMPLTSLRDALGTQCPLDQADLYDAELGVMRRVEVERVKDVYLENLQSKHVLHSISPLLAQNGYRNTVWLDPEEDTTRTERRNIRKEALGKVLKEYSMDIKFNKKMMNSFEKLFILAKLQEMCDVNFNITVSTRQMTIADKAMRDLSVEALAKPTFAKMEAIRAVQKALRDFEEMVEKDAIFLKRMQNMAENAQNSQIYGQTSQNEDDIMLNKPNKAIDAAFEIVVDDINDNDSDDGMKSSKMFQRRSNDSSSKHSESRPNIIQDVIENTPVDEITLRNELARIMGRMNNFHQFTNSKNIKNYSNSNHSSDSILDPIMNDTNPKEMTELHEFDENKSILSSFSFFNDLESIDGYASYLSSRQYKWQSYPGVADDEVNRAIYEKAMSEAAGPTQKSQRAQKAQDSQNGKKSTKKLVGRPKAKTMKLGDDSDEDGMEVLKGKKNEMENKNAKGKNKATGDKKKTTMVDDDDDDNNTHDTDSSESNSESISSGDDDSESIVEEDDYDGEEQDENDDKKSKFSKLSKKGQNVTKTTPKTQKAPKSFQPSNLSFLSSLKPHSTFSNIQLEWLEYEFQRVVSGLNLNNGLAEPISSPFMPFFYKKHQFLQYSIDLSSPPLIETSFQPPLSLPEHLNSKFKAKLGRGDCCVSSLQGFHLKRKYFDDFRVWASKWYPAFLRERRYRYRLAQVLPVPSKQSKIYHYLHDIDPNLLIELHRRGVPLKNQFRHASDFALKKSRKSLEKFYQNGNYQNDQNSKKGEKVQVNDDEDDLDQKTPMADWVHPFPHNGLNTTMNTNNPYGDSVVASKAQRKALLKAVNNQLYGDQDEDFVTSKPSQLVNNKKNANSLQKAQRNLPLFHPDPLTRPTPLQTAAFQRDLLAPVGHIPPHMQHLARMEKPLHWPQKSYGFLPETTLLPHPSSFFFINNTFYDDRRSPLSVSLSDNIIKHSIQHHHTYDIHSLPCLTTTTLTDQNQSLNLSPTSSSSSSSSIIPTHSHPLSQQRHLHDGLGLFSQHRQEDVTFAHIPIRIGEQYLFQHQGNCQHVVMFTEMRSKTTEDFNDKRMYPLILFRSDPNHLHRQRHLNLFVKDGVLRHVPVNKDNGYLSRLYDLDSNSLYPTHYPGSDTPGGPDSLSIDASTKGSKGRKGRGNNNTESNIFGINLQKTKQNSVTHDPYIEQLSQCLSCDRTASKLIYGHRHLPMNPTPLCARCNDLLVSDFGHEQGYFGTGGVESDLLAHNSHLLLKALKTSQYLFNTPALARGNDAWVVKSLAMVENYQEAMEFAGFDKAFGPIKDENDQNNHNLDIFQHSQNLEKKQNDKKLKQHIDSVRSKKNAKQILKVQSQVADLQNAMKMVNDQIVSDFYQDIGAQDIIKKAISDEKKAFNKMAKGLAVVNAGDSMKKTKNNTAKQLHKDKKSTKSIKRASTTPTTEIATSDLDNTDAELSTNDDQGDDDDGYKGQNDVFLENNENLLTFLAQIRDNATLSDSTPSKSTSKRRITMGDYDSDEEDDVGNKDNRKDNHALVHQSLPIQLSPSKPLPIFFNSLSPASPHLTFPLMPTRRSMAQYDVLSAIQNVGDLVPSSSSQLLTPHYRPNTINTTLSSATMSLSSTNEQAMNVYEALVNKNGLKQRYTDPTAISTSTHYPHNSTNPHSAPLHNINPSPQLVHTTKELFPLSPMIATTLPTQVISVKLKRKVKMIESIKRDLDINIEQNPSYSLDPLKDDNGEMVDIDMAKKISNHEQNIQNFNKTLLLQQQRQELLSNHSKSSDYLKKCVGIDVNRIDFE